MDWCLLIGMEAVAPIRDPVCFVCKFFTPLKLAMPPAQKFASSDIHKRVFTS
jgi:hypothetical protein